MKHYKTTTIPAREETYVEKETCDLCGAEGSGDSANGFFSSPDLIGDDWKFDVTRIAMKVEHRKGSSYPEGGYSTDQEVDLCPKCFVEKLIPWLESQGAKIQVTERDW